MNLLCQLEHMAGQTLLLGGREYPIGVNGLCMGLDELHAQQLLDQGDAWALVHESDFTRVKNEGDPHRNVAQPQGMAHVELPVGTELALPPDLAPVAAKVPGRRGRPKKAAEKVAP